MNSGDQEYIEMMERFEKEYLSKKEIDIEKKRTII